ncbi:Gfo/Idh/MocA family oxidoreductase [candidate division KSB1 bacterium]|nr:Gfo/Idh/MocA family oxidoreductase [candidate division KSB1 bacterium]
MRKISNKTSRRSFLKLTAAALTAPYIIPASALGKNGFIAPSDRINIGVIGVGKQGSGHVWGFLRMPETQVLAICDVDAKKLQRSMDAAAEYAESNGFKSNCVGYNDYREILARPDIDAVCIGTPDHWHAIMTIQAVKTGKDIYSEKPMTLTIAEGQRMVEAVRKYNRVFQTGSQQRSSYGFRHACELIRNGYIGEIQKVHVHIQTGFIPHPVLCELGVEPKPEELDWDLWLGPAPWRPYNSIIAPPIEWGGWPEWRNYRDYSGGGMTDWGAHHFDIAQWGLGMDESGPSEIIPPNGKDMEKLTYIYENGVTMTMDIEGNGIDFIGTEGRIFINRSELKSWPEHIVDEQIKPHEIHLYESNNHKLDWINSIKNRTKPICDVAIGASSCNVCHLGNIAIQMGRKLNWNPDMQQFIGDMEANRHISRAIRSPWRL